MTTGSVNQKPAASAGRRDPSSIADLTDTWLGTRDLAHELIKKDRIEQAIDMLDVGCDRWPENAVLNGMLADCYFKQHKFEKASEVFEHVLELDAETPFWVRIGYANAQERLGNYNNALDQLRIAAEEKISIELAKRLAWLYYMTGQQRDLVDNIRLVFATVSNDNFKSRIAAALSEFAHKHNEYTDVIRFLDLSHEHDPTWLYPVRRKIKLLLKKSNLVKARSEISDWEEANPGCNNLSRFKTIATKTRADSAKVVALYLPQFHPIPENDEWWGKGFTEWRNVSKATSLWDGHVQPRIPTDLGYYDLRLPESYDQQTALAKQYGIDGFCFYYYWFNGRKILDTPLNNILEGKTKRFPLCICWVNEDWTRSWDGSSGEVLLSTSHSLEMNMKFIEDVYPILSHPDYMRVDDKPILIVYRADKLDSTKETTNLWRDYCREQGLGEIHLCAVQSFGFDDPTVLGYDAAMEFPPHRIKNRVTQQDCHLEVPELPGMRPDFSGSVYSYQHFADCGIRRPSENYTLYRTSMLCWDNTPRRGKSAHAYVHFSVDTYARWTAANIAKALNEQSDPLVFINAWNEWAEGSVLEPDNEYGHELLQATHNAKKAAIWNVESTYWQNDNTYLLANQQSENEQILMVGHDACRNGAQINLLCMISNLVRDKSKRVTTVLAGGGELVNDYEQYGKVFVLDDQDEFKNQLEKIARDLRNKGVRKAICNTCVTGNAVKLLKDIGYNVVSLVHELPGIIQEYGLQDRCAEISNNADALVFASTYVESGFQTISQVSQDKILIAPQGIKRMNGIVGKDEIVKSVRNELDIPLDAKVILGCGYGDIRKGIDLFVQLAIKTVAEDNDYYFVWIGDFNSDIGIYLQKDIEKSIKGRILVTGFQEEGYRYMLAGDVFALTSREDPFPSVVMEAMDLGLPVLGFDECGGYRDIVNDNSGALIDYPDIDQYRTKIMDILGDEKRLKAIQDYNLAYADEHFGYDKYMEKLLSLLSGKKPYMQLAENKDSSSPSVSVIIPNYNYAEYLDLRIKTVLNQSVQPKEVIILDDASTDESMDVINAYASYTDIDIKIIPNDENSGSVFKQWKKGLAEVTGDLIWIAESDDYCDHNLVENLVVEFQDPKIVLAYTNSIMVDRYGGSYGASYSNYYKEHFGSYFESDFRVEGPEFVKDILLNRNAIMNASAVLFRASAAKESQDSLEDFQVSGDWLFWINVCMQGSVSYQEKPCNYHRRHENSVVAVALDNKSRIISEMIELCTLVADKIEPVLGSECLAESVKSIERTYIELFGDSDESVDIRANPEFAGSFKKICHMAKLETEEAANEDLYEQIKPSDIGTEKIAGVS